MINKLTHSKSRISDRKRSRLLHLLITVVSGLSLLFLFILLLGRPISKAQAAMLNGNTGQSLNQVPGVDIGVDENGSGLPADIVTYYHTLTNTGDSPDTFTLTLESALPSGWNVMIDPETTGSVSPGGTTPFTVMVQIAGDAISGTVYAANIQAASMTDPLVIDTLTDTTTVNGVFGLSIVPDNNTGSAAAGEDISYTHFIINNSNSADMVKIETLSTPNWTISPTTQTVSVAPFGVEPFSITISIPADAAGMVHTALLTATSSLSASLQVTATDITTVIYTPDVLLEPDNFKFADPGDVVTYVHTLTNTGDITDSYAISAVSSQGWPITYTTSTPVLSPTADVTITVIVTVPGGAAPGMVDVTTVTATSNIDPAVQDSATDTTRVRQIHDIVFYPDNVGMGGEGTVISYTHTLSNASDGPDTFGLTVGSSNGWTTAVSPISITLLPGESTQVTATLTIPGGTAGMVDTMVVTATSIISPAFSATVMDTTTVSGTQPNTGVLIEPDNMGLGFSGSNIYYNHVVTNTTNQTYVFEVVAKSSHGWFTLPSPTFPETMTLAAGQSMPIEIFMAIGSVPSGTIDTMVVTATAVVDPAIVDTAINVTTVLTEQVGGVSVFPNRATTAMPGDLVTYTHLLRNTGNDLDTFTITVSSDQGWPVSVMPTSISLFAGQQIPVTVTVSVPPSAISGTVDTTTVMATSSFNPAVSDVALDVTTVITQPTGGGGVSITPDNVGMGAPGETLEYGHTLANLSSNIETFDLTVDSSQGWQVFVNPSNIQMLGNTSRTVSVTVMIPASATSGTVDVTTVTATAQSDPGITDSATDTTTVFGSSQPIVFMPAIYYAGSTPPPTPTPTPTTSPCILNQPPAGNPAGVDLIITNIVLVPANPQPGQNTNIQVTIKNQGQTDVSYGNNFYLDFYDTPNPEPPQAFQIGDLAWGVQGADLEAGASKTFSANFVFGAGNHRLWAQVDTDRTVSEANENNNLYGCKALTVSGAQPAVQGTPEPQPTADQPRATPTPAEISPPEAAVPPKSAVTPAP